MTEVGIPYTDIILRTGEEEIRALAREDHTVDHTTVTRPSELHTEIECDVVAVVREREREKERERERVTTHTVPPSSSVRIGKTPKVLEKDIITISLK